MFVLIASSVSTCETQERETSNILAALLYKITAELCYRHNLLQHAKNICLYSNK